jgi:Etoposide-induced protein 2.4 (EI24)
MKQILDAFWRAVAYCLHPRVIALSLVPLVLMVGIAFGFGYFFWESTLASVNAWLLQSNWLLLVILAVTPVVVIASLLFVAFLMTPAMVALVAERRFDTLERKKGAGVVSSVLWSLGAVLVAAVALLASVPLWLIPPLILIVPPLIWGWLTYRVMAFDALAEHASKDERREVMKRHRMQLLGMGVVAGYLGAAPTLLWASGVMFVVFAPIFIVAAIWVYTLVFAFSSLWFAHFCLDALHRLRAEQALVPKDIFKPNEALGRIKSAQGAPDLVANHVSSGAADGPNASSPTQP